MPQPDLHTPRLRLRARTAADIDAIMAMDADPEVQRFLGGPPDPEAHRAWVTGRIAAGVADNWAIERRDQPGLIGLCSICPKPDATGNQITWRLVRRAWGEGLATEAAAAVLRHATMTPGYGAIVAIIHPDNAASAGVARKIGMHPIGEADYYGGRRIIYGLATPC